MVMAASSGEGAETVVVPMAFPRGPQNGKGSKTIQLPVCIGRFCHRGGRSIAHLDLLLFYQLANCPGESVAGLIPLKLLRHLTSSVLTDPRRGASWTANERIALENEFDGHDYVIAKIDVERPIADSCPRKIERQR
jgi:hypothetical protein